MKAHAVLTIGVYCTSITTHIFRTKSIPEISQLDQYIKVALSAIKANHKYFELQFTIFKDFNSCC